ncbi:MAG: MBL fold metallo-hydrolase [Syntrophomonadaceae bacterium]|nr:MBL fold metallo-hydrolase [Syntrophomonadaceae bacterium]
MIIELTKKIKVIRPEAKAIFPYSNSMFIDDEIQTCIDAGAGGHAYSDINVDDIALLLLSHNHFDHVNGISFFKNARIMAGREEEKSYIDQDYYLMYSGYLEWPRLMGSIDREELTGIIALPDDIPARRGYQEVKLAGLIKDGDVFDLGATKVMALHTPGHTPGHYAYYFEKEGILFSGDIDLAPRGPWYGGGLSSFDDLIGSVQKVIEINPRILVTSHRRIFDSGNDNIVQLLKDYINISLHKEEQSLKYLSEPRTIDDIAGQDFINDFKHKTPFALFWTKMMIDKHIQRLIKMGKIKQIDSLHYIKN